MTDNLFERGLPSDVELEKLVLGAAMVDDEGGSARIVTDGLTAEDFAPEIHRRIFSVMAALLEQGVKVDRVTVAERLQTLGKLQSVGGISYLISLDDGLPRIYAIEDYVLRIRAIAIARRAVLTMHRAVGEILDAKDTASVIRAEEALRSLATEAEQVRRSGGLASIDEFLSTFPGGVQEFLGGKQEVGVTSPWPSLNEQLAGLARGTLTVIAASAGMGKSQTAMQWAIHAAKQGIPVGVFSLEMSTEELWRRAVALEYGDAPDAVRRHRIRTSAPVGALAGLPLMIDQSMSQTVSSLVASVRRANRRQKLGLIVIDYLQLVESRGSNRVEAVSAITRGLKTLAREVDAAVLALSQVNRESQKEERPPRLIDLRESGSIEQDADNVLFLYQPQKDRAVMFADKCPMPCEVIVAKQRNGPAGGRVKMRWNFPLARLEELRDLGSMRAQDEAAA